MHAIVHSRQILPDIVGTARVHFDDPVDRRLAGLTAIQVPEPAAARSEGRKLAALQKAALTLSLRIRP